MRRFLILAAAVAVIALAACEAETEPATNVTSTTATLNGKGRCTTQESGRYKWQTLVQQGQSSWVDQSDWIAYNCSGPMQSFATLPGEGATGLVPNAGHYFRILADPGEPGGATFTIDRDWGDNQPFAQGGDNGEDYDSFTTQPSP